MVLALPVAMAVACYALAFGVFRASRDTTSLAARVGAYVAVGAMVLLSALTLNVLLERFGRSSDLAFAPGLIGAAMAWIVLRRVERRA